jgi:nucleoside-diphosphate-sugar epimerase
MRVLITGANGYVGRQLAQGLAAEHELRLADVQAPDYARSIRLDVTDPAQAMAAMRDVDAVVHLAVASGHEGDFEDVAFNQQRFDVNVKGTWNILEAARLAKVKRVVHTSSIMVTWGYSRSEIIAADAPPRPAGTYALTKAMAESICESFAREHGMSIVCLRIPKPIALDDPHWRTRPIRPQWLAFPDLIQAYRLALCAPGIAYEVITVVGERGRWDLEKAKRVLGYRPTIRLEEGGYVLGDEREPFEVNAHST